MLAHDEQWGVCVLPDGPKGFATPLESLLSCEIQHYSVSLCNLCSPLKRTGLFFQIQNRAALDSESGVEVLLSCKAAYPSAYPFSSCAECLSSEPFPARKGAASVEHRIRTDRGIGAMADFIQSHYCLII